MLCVRSETSDTREATTLSRFHRHLGSQSIESVQYGMNARQRTFFTDILQKSITAKHDEQVRELCIAWVDCLGIMEQFHHKFLLVLWSILRYAALIFEETETVEQIFRIEVRNTLDADCLMEWGPGPNFGRSSPVPLTESVCASCSDQNRLWQLEYYWWSRSPKNRFATQLPASSAAKWWNGGQRIAPKPAKQS